MKRAFWPIVHKLHFANSLEFCLILISIWINTWYKFIIITETPNHISLFQIQIQKSQNSLKSSRTFLQLFASNLDSSGRFSIPITNSCTSDDLLKHILRRITGNCNCWSLEVHKTVGDFVELEHNWATILTSIIYWSLDELLFSPVKLWNWRFHWCCSSKVRFRSLQFMQLVGASCRSHHDMNTELWTYRFHAIFN